MVKSEIHEMEHSIRDISDIASRLGLDPFPIQFEIVPANIMHELGSYGLPGRYSHWTHGRSYQRSKTMYDYGLTKVYEMVINSNPAYACLLDTNSILQNKVVAAHVTAHVHLFRHNEYFKFTNRYMVNTVGAHADRIRRYEYEHGKLAVEKFIDTVLSLEWNIDPHTHLKSRLEKEEVQRPKETDYDDLFYLGSNKRPDSVKVKPNFPIGPESDILLFIAENSRELEDWQRDIIHIIRNESIYFSPQARTKPLNEGFATFCHSRIMREMDLSSTEYIEFSQMHSNILAHSPAQFNPYALGFAIFEDIEERWNNPTDEDKERSPSRKTGQGMAKVLEVASVDNDVSLIRNYFTEKVCEEQELYRYSRDKNGKLVAVDKDWKLVREKLVTIFTNNGNPYILVENGNYKNNGELLLRHQYEGQELDINYTEKTLVPIYNLWGRTVHIATKLKDKPVVMSFDGEQKKKEGDP